MLDLPGISVYLSTFQQQKPLLTRLRGSGVKVFLSLHISGEFSSDYRVQTEEVCRWLSQAGFETIADVSPKTIAQFGEPDLVRLAKRLRLWGLRVDYGLTDGEIMALAWELRETGLSVAAFIPGDELLRGPLHEGLPTLERHRGRPPSVSFADITGRFEVDEVLVADPGISEAELARIRRYCDEGVLELPAALAEEYRSLYGRVFTCRADSPRRLIRFWESREYSCAGAYIAPQNCVGRRRGSVTIDNGDYGRYSGEIQLTRTDLPADPRVNVIGKIAPAHLPAADAIGGGGQFVLTPM